MGTKKGKKIKLSPLEKSIVNCQLLHGEMIDYKQTKRGISIKTSGLNPDLVDNIVVLEMAD